MNVKYLCFYSLAQKALVSSAPFEHSLVPLQRAVNSRYSSPAEHWNILLTEMSIINFYERYCGAPRSRETCHKLKSVFNYIQQASYPIEGLVNE